MVNAPVSGRRWANWVVLGCAMILSACSKPAPPPPKAPPQVGVITLHAQPVTIATELPGRTVAYRIAEVRPQVAGVILKRLFIEGSEVAAGQQLYQIDPAPYRASLDSAKASLARAEASLTSAKLLAERYKPLTEAHAVSKQANDNAVAAQDQALADVASAKASVESAQINLTYTRVLAPISGHTGRSSVTEGALVSVGQSTSLVVVQQLDPIYVDMNQPSAVLLRLKRSLADGKLEKAGDSQAVVRLTLEDGSSYEPDGRLQFAEVAVDSSTGSVTLRAVFPNPQRVLLPGMFVQALLDEGVNEHGLLVPQQAVTHNQSGAATTIVVGADNKIRTQVIKTERAVGDQWLVSEGLADGERVVADGLQRLGNGVAQVNPKEISVDELRAGPAAAPTAPQ